MNSLLRTSSYSLRNLNLRDRIKNNRGSDDEVEEIEGGDNSPLLGRRNGNDDGKGPGIIQSIKDKLRNRDDDDTAGGIRDGRYSNDQENEEEDNEEVSTDRPFELTQVKCEQDDSGMLGDPTVTSKIEKIEFFYNLEVTPDGASKLQSEIIPKVEKSLAVGIGSVFVDSCKRRRMLRPLLTLPSGESAHRSLEIVALDANPSKIIDASCEESQMKSIENVCKVIEASYNLYFEGMTDVQIEVSKNATLKVIEWNMRDGFFNNIDSSIVGATYTSQASSTDVFLTNSIEGISPEASSQFPIYLIIGGVCAGCIVIIIALVAICRKPSAAANKGNVQMKNLSTIDTKKRSFSKHSTRSTISDLS